MPEAAGSSPDQFSQEKPQTIFLQIAYSPFKCLHLQYPDYGHT